MSRLKDQPADLIFDEKEMLKWGYLWRIGRKVRKKRAADDEGDDGDNDIGAQDEADVVGESEVAREIDFVDGVAAVHEEAAVYEVVAGEKASVISGPLTAADVGLPEELAAYVVEDKYPSSFTKKQGMDFGMVFDRAVGEALAGMLGDIPIVDHAKSTALKKQRATAWKQHIQETLAAAKAAGDNPPKRSAIALPNIDVGIEWTINELLPPIANCVEVGPARIIGGIRPQNFDVAYRPDGPRIVYDSKTLNDADSIPKNWQNMVNDLGTEATTVHTRFPYAIVAFIVAVPKPAIRASQLADLIRTLERLATRETVIDQAHLAEAIAFVVWDPATGKIDGAVPDPNSSIHLNNFMRKIHRCYVERYKGLPPHDK